MRIFGLLLLIPLVAAGSEVFTRDGVTDGDTFYLAPGATINNEPVYQSWVAYSLMKSACQLEIGGPNPARANSFECEFKSRRRLVEAWYEQRQKDPDLEDTYLDALTDVQFDGFLAEYTAHFFADRNWSLPSGLRDEAFDDYRARALRRHKPLTRIIGSWNFKEKVETALRDAND